MARPKISAPAPKAGQKLAEPAPAIKKPDPDKNPPLFCLRYLQPGWCVSDCQQEEKARFADTLRKLSQLTWAEIRHSSRHKLGTETIARAAIQAKIPAVVTEDVTLLAIRFSGMKAMVGFREDAIFRVIWLDREFKLYKH